VVAQGTHLGALLGPLKAIVEPSWCTRDQKPMPFCRGPGIFPKTRFCQGRFSKTRKHETPSQTHPSMYHVQAYENSEKDPARSQKEAELLSRERKFSEAAETSQKPPELLRRCCFVGVLCFGGAFQTPEPGPATSEKSAPPLKPCRFRFQRPDRDRRDQIANAIAFRSRDRCLSR